MRKPPDDRPAQITEMPERMAASGLFIVPEEHRTAVFEGLAEAERGDFAADKEMAALWKKCGL